MLPLTAASSPVFPTQGPNQTKGPIVRLFTISGTTSPRLRRNPAISHLQQWMDSREEVEKVQVGGGRLTAWQRVKLQHREGVVVGKSGKHWVVE